MRRLAGLSELPRVFRFLAGCSEGAVAGLPPLPPPSTTWTEKYARVPGRAKPSTGRRRLERPSRGSRAAANSSFTLPATPNWAVYLGRRPAGAVSPATCSAALLAGPELSGVKWW